MEDGEFSVDILDANGQPAGTKLRKDIIKGQDIYHAVYGILLTPDGSVGVSKIAARPDLPNLHAGLHGFSAATIKRSGETADEAMSRAVQNELGIQVRPEKYSETLEDVDNTKRMVSVYIINSSLPESFSTKDTDEIVSFTPDELSLAIAKTPESFTPLLKRFWETYLAQSHHA